MKKTHKLLFILIVIVGLSFLVCNQKSFSESSVKTPNVSGIFYPANKEELAKMIDLFLNRFTDVKTPSSLIGFISPHAGLIYSGPVAAYAYSRLSNLDFKTVVIIGSSHYQRLNKIAIFSEGSFQTPLGNILIDTEFARSLMSQNQDIEHLTKPFTKEHSIEMQLIFLQRSLKNFRIIPILINPESYEQAANLAKTLTTLIGKRKDVLLIASSDMSHFHSQEKAREIDEKTLTLIQAANPYQLFLATQKQQSELCGTGAVITLMLTAANLKANKIEVLKYATSFDTTKTSKERVVGYASIIFSRTKNNSKRRREDMLTPEQRKKLLSIAHASISEFVKHKKRPEINETDPALLGKKGAFVTIKENGKLRGCIGHIVADTALINTVSEMAIEAATGDPRFPPLAEEELSAIKMEISVLSPLKLISDIKEIEVGKHGLLIRKAFYSGLLLPQVATEYNWSKEEFLRHACLKAGLGPDDWKKGTQIYIFSAEVFGEDEY